MGENDVNKDTFVSESYKSEFQIKLLLTDMLQNMKAAEHVLSVSAVFF
jgi:hypothetical protein